MYYEYVLFLIFPGLLGGATNSLALPHIDTFAQLIIKNPACQLLGEKDEKRLPKTIADLVPPIRFYLHEELYLRRDRDIHKISGDLGYICHFRSFSVAKTHVA